MSASAEPRPARATKGAASRRSRRAERAPSGGWRTIAAKELADHLGSVRFIVLLVIVGVAAVIPTYLTSTTITDSAPQLAGRSAVFLLLFAPPPDAVVITTVAFVALLVPLVGISFGFDAVNSERSQGTLSRLLAQPIHRDDVINGKFAAGLAVIALMLAALVVLISALGIVRLGIIPSAEEVMRVVTWLLVSILYAGFWLAFAVLLSVVLRGAASAALVGFGTWLGLTIFGAFLLPLLANALFPSDTSSYENLFASTGAQQMFLRISPAQLYQDIVTVVMNPAAKGLFVGSIGQAVSAQSQIPSLLSFDQSVLLVWPQIVALVALTVVTFALAYVLFLRQEVRA